MGGDSLRPNQTTANLLEEWACHAPEPFRVTREAEARTTHEAASRLLQVNERLEAQREPKGHGGKERFAGQ